MSTLFPGMNAIGQNRRFWRPLSSLHSRNRNKSGGGFLLVIVLVTIVLISLAAYSFTALMQVEEEAARLQIRQVQSKYLADSGVDYVRMFLANDEATIREKGGVWDNAISFQAIPVGIDPDDPELFGRFTIISSSMDDDGTPEGFRFGLYDESNKLNVNTLIYADGFVEGGGHQLLMALPNMTDSIADSILDWIDGDDDERDFGCESSYYNGLPSPYAAKNGPLDSLDELLLIRGVTSQMLFGMDTNRNGVIDEPELAASGGSALNADSMLGWASYMTLHSKESNLNSEGLARVNLNNPDLNQLYTDLRSAFNEEWTRFIIQYRINGPYTLKEDDEPVAANVPITLDLEAESQFTFSQILDLVDAYTTATNPDNPDETIVLQSPVNSLNKVFTIVTLMKNATTYEGENIPGRINIMQAPRRILASIPGMTDELLDTIIDLREFELDDPTGADIGRGFETWLYTEDYMDLVTMRTMLPYICVGGDVYSAEVTGFYDDGVGISRVEVIVDNTVPIPRILFWRDKTHLGSGFSPIVLGAANFIK